MGMLIQFAAATAQNGTNRPMIGGANFEREFKPSAVTKAPPVAHTYDVASWLERFEHWKKFFML
jgi:hypothetical protein